MAKTAVVRQREYRQRLAARVSERDAEADMLRRALAEAQSALEDANAEIERLSAMVCKHPPGAMSGGWCNACGNDVD